MGEGDGQSLKSNTEPGWQRRQHAGMGTDPWHLLLPKCTALSQLHLPSVSSPPPPMQAAPCRIPTARAVMPGVFAGTRVLCKRACRSRYLAPRRSKSRRRIRDKTLQVFPCRDPPSCEQLPTPLLPTGIWLSSAGRKQRGAGHLPPGIEMDTVMWDQRRRWDRSCQMGLKLPPNWRWGG